MAQKALELDPTYPVSMINFARAIQTSWRAPAGGRYLPKLLGFAPDDPGLLSLLAREHAVSGDAPAARKIEAQLEKMRSQRYVTAL